jgi:hypothetical protein
MESGMTSDDAAQAPQRGRETIARRLAQVEATIAQWHAWEANRFLVPEQQRPLPRPDLSLAGCLEVRRMLREELATLRRAG